MGKKSSKKIKPTAAEIAEAEIANAKWGHYRQKYFAVEEDLARRANTDYTKLLERRAMADVANNLDKQAVGILGEGFKKGFMPGSGRSLGLVAGIGNIRAAGLSEAENASRRQAQKFVDGLRLNTLGLGAGIDAQSLTALSGASRASTSEAIARAEGKAASNRSMWSAAGQLAGAAYGRWGDDSGPATPKADEWATNIDYYRHT